jgi:hypothetical protein
MNNMRNSSASAIIVDFIWILACICDHTKLDKVLETSNHTSADRMRGDMRLMWFLR